MKNSNLCQISPFRNQKRNSKRRERKVGEILFRTVIIKSLNLSQEQLEIEEPSLFQIQQFPAAVLQLSKKKISFLRKSSIFDMSQCRANGVKLRNNIMR
jgi:hypothetical protein